MYILKAVKAKVKLKLHDNRLHNQYRYSNDQMFRYRVINKRTNVSFPRCPDIVLTECIKRGSSYGSDHISLWTNVFHISQGNYFGFHSSHGFTFFGLV